MKITTHPLTIRDLYAGFKDSGDAGVSALGGALDIRPPYQREFVYNAEQQRSVIATVLDGAPLSLIYWAARNPEPVDANQAAYEVLDGQQRTLSICRFVDGAFSIKDDAGNDMMFHSLPVDVQDQILDYELLVYVCDGSDSDKLKWFRRINIAGEQLTEQELRNAVYAGSWLTDAKRRFSRTGGAAMNLGEGYVKGVAIRQELLELALKWAVLKDNDASLEEHMSKHQHDANANALWGLYSNVVEWAKAVFPERRKELKSPDWGELYLAHGQRTDLDSAQLEARIKTLMADEDVTKKTGVYEYVLTGSERLLSIRQFSDRDKRTAYEKQHGLCGACREPFDIVKLQADHIVPWSQGGRTVSENCEMLCKDCHDTKTRRQLQATASQSANTPAVTS